MSVRVETGGKPAEEMAAAGGEVIGTLLESLTPAQASQATVEADKVLWSYSRINANGDGWLALAESGTPRWFGWLERVGTEYPDYAKAAHPAYGEVWRAGYKREGAVVAGTVVWGELSPGAFAVWKGRAGAVALLRAGNADPWVRRMAIKRHPQWEHRAAEVREERAEYVVAR